MKKKKLFLIYYLILLLPLSACYKDWLDVKPDKSLAVPLMVEDFQAILDNSTVLNVNSTIVLGEVAADGHYFLDNDWNSYLGSIYQNAYTWTNSVIATSVNDWNNPYHAILTMNVVLEGADKISSDQRVTHIIGQALFQRSRLYYDIVSTFSPVYPGDAESKSVLSIPLRLNTDITEPSVHADLFTVYQTIVNDLKRAIDLLPIEPEHITRASRPACMALLSRIYLSMQKYDSALVYADRCLSMKSDLLDYNTIPASKQFIGVNKEIIFFNYFTPRSVTTNHYYIDSLLYSLYQQNDLRKQAFFSQVGTRQQFKGTYGNSATDVFSGIAVDEVYLIRSECFARIGQLSNAMKDLNTILKTRWKTVNGISTFVNRTAGTEMEALRMILEERRKQLILRNVRWSDLKRLNLDPRTAAMISRVVKGVTYTLEPNSYKYTFPIPNYIIQTTTLTQNKGWE